MPSHARTPVVLAMIVAESAQRDQQTHRYNIMGCTRQINADSFPHEHPQLCVYVAASECQGETSFSFRVTDMDDEVTLYQSGSNRAVISDPLGIVEFTLTVQYLEFPTPGEYRVHLLFGGTPIAERKLLLAARPRGEPDDS